MNNTVKPPLKKFLEESLKCRVKDGNLFDYFMKEGYLTFNSITFKTTETFNKERQSCIRAIQKKLGTDILSEKEILDLLHKYATETVDEKDIEKKIPRFIEEVSDISNTELKYIIPNYAITLVDGVEEFSIGKVKCILTKNLKKENLPISKKINPSDSHELGTSIRLTGADTFIHVGLSPQCFIITLKASHKNANHLANWYADVALSLVRLYSYKTKRNPPLFPRIGEVDPLPFEKRDNRDKALIVTSKSTSHCGGDKLHKKYEITPEIKKKINKYSFSAVCQKIFEGTEGTVSERMQRALGWMARARSSASVPERFLFFFTALEALLTNDDKTAPVTETIARHVATILAKPKDRFFIYQKVKNLYGIRSGLVHSGKRSVSETDCNQLQLYTELTCLTVIEKSLSQKVENFQSSLRQAGFGEKWP